MTKHKVADLEMEERTRELCSCLGLTRLRNGEWIVDEEIVAAIAAFASSEVEVYRKALRIMIGRKRCVPRTEISEEDVDSYIEEARRLK